MSALSTWRERRTCRRSSSTVYNASGTYLDYNYGGSVVAAGATADPAGNPSAGTSFNFFVPRGDLNHDRAVNFADLLTLAQNYGKIGRTFAEGNIDYSPTGNVGFEDLLLLSQQYGRTLSVELPAGRKSAEKRDRSVAADVLQV